MNVDLLEMGSVRLEEIDEREADRRIVGERHAESPLALCRLENLRRRDFLQYSFRRMPCEKPSGGQLDRRDTGQVAGSRECDLVAVRRMVHVSLERNHWSTDSAPGPTSASAASAHMYRRLISYPGGPKTGPVAVSPMVFTALNP